MGKPSDANLDSGHRQIARSSTTSLNSAQVSATHAPRSRPRTRSRFRTRARTRSRLSLAGHIIDRRIDESPHAPARANDGRAVIGRRDAMRRVLRRRHPSILHAPSRTGALRLVGTRRAELRGVDGSVRVIRICASVGGRWAGRRLGGAARHHEKCDEDLTHHPQIRNAAALSNRGVPPASPLRV